MTYSNKVAIVTGASGGIGRAVAERLLSLGYTVYGVSRRACDLGEIHHIQADVTDADAVSRAMAQIASEAGGIDLLVSNAGFGISGAAEFTNPADAHRQMDVNFFGFFYCARAVIPYMREKGGGTIIAVSSVAAVLPVPFQSFYSASKAAINALVMTLRSELLPFHIRVAAVMPGDVATGFTAARERGDVGEEFYGKVMARSVSTMEKDEQSGMTSAYVAGKICRIAAKKRPAPLYTIGHKYKLLTCLNKLLPARLACYIEGMIYAR